MRKGCPFLICTKAPYGLAIVLEIHPGKSQKRTLRSHLPLKGGGRRGAQEGDAWAQSETSAGSHWLPWNLPGNVVTTLWTLSIFWFNDSGRLC